MNQVKIGNFITQCRKNKNLTQNELANMLNITDRAVSKWENGKGLPDSSLMLDLCKILDISVNELLSGEKIDMVKYDKKAEERLLEMAMQEEIQNKKLMLYEKVIGFMSSIIFFVLIFISSYIELSNITRILLIVLAVIIFIVGASFALKIETETGYYECKKCNNKYIPRYKDVYFAMHIGTTRYLKCPKCNKRSWSKKVMHK